MLDDRASLPLTAAFSAVHLTVANELTVRRPFGDYQKPNHGNKHLSTVYDANDNDTRYKELCQAYQGLMSCSCFPSS